MHQGAPYGHLALPSTVKDGSEDILRPILPVVLARMVGCTLEEVEQLLSELENAGVFSRTNEGTIFSRRMVQDEKVREARARGGKESLNNPNVPRPKSTKQTVGRVSFDPSLGGSPSSSSSSSSSSLEPKASNSNESQDDAGSMPEGFNSTSVAQIICQQNGWSGRQLLWAVKDAIDFQSKQRPEDTLEQVGEWLVQAYRDHRSSKDKFAVGPQKFFGEGLYQSTEPSPIQKTNLLTDNPATRALAQMGGE
jgi:hypothetical protein